MEKTKLLWMGRYYEAIWNGEMQRFEVRHLNGVLVEPFLAQDEAIAYAKGLDDAQITINSWRQENGK